MHELDILSEKGSSINEAVGRSTYVGTVSDTFEIESDTGADFLNTTYDIIEVHSKV